MKQYKGIIFDLDGTLLNTISDIGNSMNAVLQELDLPTFTEAEYKQKVGGGFILLVERVLPKNADIQLKEDVLQRFISVYSDHHTDTTAPYEGILELLHLLNDLSIPIAINSNKQDDAVRALVPQYFPGIHFVDTIGMTETYGAKPAPTAALVIVQEMKLELTDVLFIGDSDVDMKTGKNAQLDTIGVTWGFRTEAELLKNGATYIAHKPQDILQYVATR